MKHRLYEFVFSLAPDDRDAIAVAAGTTRAYLQQLAYANKRAELGLADCIVALSDGRVSLDDVPLTERAAEQRRTRERVSA